ncbi:Bug family tripartite tricarboxylate transporter substrate binding protein [Hydrogenophaga sp. OTU3427]|uniref:Bug family tripartite tricarboxylate transporter substrate binding protein n=1 Tax=Hydrogenophaga sp. OTU3427 TaxID=3043856 RepID=UPI00313D26F1
MRTRRELLLAAGALCASGLATAQSWPARPIRLVVPFTPGGSSDLLGRAIGQKLSESLGQPVVIDNVPGAGGSLGADRVAKAAPDGHTLLMGHIGTHAVNPLIVPNLSYDPVKHFAPVAWVANVPNVLVVHPSVPARNLKELVALARARPGQLNYGTGGNGSAAHLATEYLKLRTQTFIVHVPYRGAAPAITDLVAGQTQLIFTGAPALTPFVKSGQLRALAVSSSKRLEALPDVPTVAESGYPGFEADQWYGVLAPAGTPPDIVRKLNSHINQALATPELRQRLQSEGAVAMPATPEAFGSLIARELDRWRPVVKAGNIRPN